MRPSEAARLVARMVAAFPQRPISSDTAAVYAEALADLEVDDAAAAIDEMILTCKWFPQISEIRDASARRRADLPTASDAWGEVVRAVSGSGRYRPVPKFSHPAIDRVVGSMGWIALCDSDNQVADRAHFSRMYSETAARVLHEVNVRPALAAAAERRELGHARTGEMQPVLAFLPGGKART